MFNYCVFEVYNENGALREKIAANFKSRGKNHSHKMIDTYIDAYQKSLYPRELTVNYTVYFNKTNPAFMANQLKVYRGNVSGFVSHQIALKDNLKSMV
jgi:hypothetical protein